MTWEVLPSSEGELTSSENYKLNFYPCVFLLVCSLSPLIISVSHPQGLHYFAVNNETASSIVHTFYNRHTNKVGTRSGHILKYIPDTCNVGKETAC